MVRTTGAGRTTAGAQWWLLSETGLIIEVPDIGTATHITSGSRDTGVGGITNKSGSAVITSYADTDQQVRSTNEYYSAGCTKPQRIKRKRTAVARQPNP